MFWTIVGILVAAVLLGGYLWDRKARRRHDLGDIDVGKSPRYGAGDATGENFGIQVSSGRQGGHVQDPSGASGLGGSGM